MVLHDTVAHGAIHAWLVKHLNSGIEIEDTLLMQGTEMAGLLEAVQSVLQHPILCTLLVPIPGKFDVKDGRTYNDRYFEDLKGVAIAVTTALAEGEGIGGTYYYQRTR